MRNSYLMKFSSYLGLCAALLLGLVFLYPQRESFSQRGTHITPVDNDAISYFVQRSSPSFELLIRVERFVGRCPQGPSTHYYCDFSSLAPDPLELVHLEKDLSLYIPGFRKKLDDSMDSGMNSYKLRRLQERVIGVYPELLGGYRSKYIVATSVAHAMFAILLVAMIWWRRQVGSFLMCLVLVPLKLVFRGAADIHRKV